MFQRFVDVAVRLPVHQAFTYELPAHLSDSVELGQLISVTLRGRPEEAIVTAIHQNAPGFATRSVDETISQGSLVSEEQIQLAAWMSEQYLAGPGECLFKMFPSGRRPGKLRAVKTPEATRPALNADQQKAFESIAGHLAARSSERPPVHVLHGITGSGKTEVYIRVIRKARELGRGAVLLVPEIALTVQLIARLREVFGDELVLLHSGLRKSERLAGYLALLRGERAIAVGTRSAVFAPVANPGVFILDEEHDGSYKEHSAPRYHARQIAYHRAETNGAVLVLGSATPAVETRYHAEHSQDFFYHPLPKRATGAPLPPVSIVRLPAPDVPISGELLRELESTIGAGHQALLLLNRRGYHPFLYCAACSKSIQCNNCSVTLNLHRDGRLVCHYCGLTRAGNNRCDTCGGPLRRLGSGTQKLEEYILNLYSEWRVERLDSDSASRANVVETAVGRLLAGELDVLLGTQMIAKGLDAPNVTLVGVLQADLGLSQPDFRAGERTFALLTQVAGRAGRAEHRGRVIFEVLNPKSPVVEQAARHDYGEFYAQELAMRRAALYPPFCRIVRLLCRSAEQEHASAGASAVAAILEEVYRSATPPTRPLMLGPAPAPLERLHGQYRMHVVLKTTNLAEVRRVIAGQWDRMRAQLRADAYLEIDFDPTDLS